MTEQEILQEVREYQENLMTVCTELAQLNEPLFKRDIDLNLTILEQLKGSQEMKERYPSITKEIQGNKRIRLVTLWERLYTLYLSDDRRIGRELIARYPSFTANLKRLNKCIGLSGSFSEFKDNLAYLAMLGVVFITPDQNLKGYYSIGMVPLSEHLDDLEKRFTWVQADHKIIRGAWERSRKSKGVDNYYLPTLGGAMDYMLLEHSLNPWQFYKKQKGLPSDPGAFRTGKKKVYYTKGEVADQVKEKISCLITFKGYAKQEEVISYLKHYLTATDEKATPKFVYFILSEVASILEDSSEFDYRKPTRNEAQWFKLNPNEPIYVPNGCQELSKPERNISNKDRYIKELRRAKLIKPNERVYQLYKGAQSKAVFSKIRKYFDKGLFTNDQGDLFKVTKTTRKGKEIFRCKKIKGAIDKNGRRRYSLNMFTATPDNTSLADYQLLLFVKAEVFRDTFHITEEAMKTIQEVREPLNLAYPVFGLEVHHLNKNPSDNRLENLYLMTPKEHHQQDNGKPLTEFKWFIPEDLNN